MECKAMKVVLYDKILEESKNEIVFSRDNKEFVGALFFEKDSYEIIKEVIVEEIIQSDNEEDLIDKCIRFYVRNAEKHFNSTEKTMKHWQFINGFTRCIVSDYGKGA